MEQAPPPQAPSLPQRMEFFFNHVLLGLGLTKEQMIECDIMFQMANHLQQESNLLQKMVTLKSSCIGIEEVPHPAVPGTRVFHGAIYHGDHGEMEFADYPYLNTLVEALLAKEAEYARLDRIQARINAAQAGAALQNASPVEIVNELPALNLTGAISDALAEAGSKIAAAINGAADGAVVS